MPYSPQRRSAIVHNPIAYRSPSPPRKSKDRRESHGSKRPSRSSERSLTPVGDPTSPGSFQPSTTRRSYRYHRIVQAPRRKKSDRSNRKLGYGAAAAVLVVLGLLAAGLYVYYFVDGQTSKKASDVLLFSPTLQPVKTSTEGRAEPGNVTEGMAKVENVTLMDENFSTEAGKVTAAGSETTVSEIADEITVSITEEAAAIASTQKAVYETNWTVEAPTETTATTVEERIIDEAFYYSEKICVDDERNRECVAGTGAEAGICSQGGACTRVQYHVNDDPGAGSFDPDLEHRHLDLKNWPAPDGTLCRRESGQLLGVCSNGQCMYVYNGSRRFHQIEGHWKDNCDRVNPCWTTPSAVPTENRSVCTMTPIDCDQDTQCSSGATVAVVWLEHRYCYINPARAAAYCKGLPFRLWLCRFCRGRNFPPTHGLELARAHAMDACLQKFSAVPRSSSTSQCIVSCHHLSTKDIVGSVVMPNGSVCQITNGQDKTGYCYMGRCFPAEASLYEEKLQTVDECEDQKRIDAEKWNM